jgi:GntR family transcriptional repressor for pyruvate dehydrogenase complex
LYEQIATHIEQLISSGTLQPGDQLPPERELADRLGVGRGVVREAIKLLAERGLVAILPGRGTFVAELDPNILSDQLGRYFKVGRSSFRDLNEARNTLEVEIAGLAALRASKDDLEEMRQAIQDMETFIDSPDDYIEADLVFHSVLARATENEIFSLLGSVITDLLQESRRTIFQVPGAPARGQNWHRLIYQAIENGDPDAARESMRKHMQQVTEDAKAAESLS